MRIAHGSKLSRAGAERHHNSNAQSHVASSNPAYRAILSAWFFKFDVSQNLNLTYNILFELQWFYALHLGETE